METSKVTRLEIIDNTPCKYCGGSGIVDSANYANQPTECMDCHGAGFAGRDVVFHNKNTQIELSLQDDGRTLKVFINERDKE